MCACLLLFGGTWSNWLQPGVKLRSNFLQPRSSAPKRVGIRKENSLLCVAAAAQIDLLHGFTDHLMI
ncbi:hypothetical protein NQZ68_022626 [Dissostichus eleginoides]|nr:hypothetical protein NQZ68_022626 [Dissostichus eleginoides]